VIGRFCEDNVIGDKTWTSIAAGPGKGTTMRTGLGLLLENASDLSSSLTIKAGRTKDQAKGFRLVGLDNKIQWAIYSPEPKSLTLWDGLSDFSPITLNHDGSTQITAARNNPVVLGRGSTGGVEFASEKSIVASVDKTGKGTFEGGLCQSSNVCWTTGKGTPPAEACNHSKGGSLYTRIDGGPGSSLYVCDGETGAWTGK
jgi:hypothetical protein